MHVFHSSICASIYTYTLHLIIIGGSILHWQHTTACAYSNCNAFSGRRIWQHTPCRQCLRCQIGPISFVVNRNVTHLDLGEKPSPISADSYITASNVRGHILDLWGGKWTTNESIIVIIAYIIIQYCIIIECSVNFVTALYETTTQFMSS